MSLPGSGDYIAPETDGSSELSATGHDHEARTFVRTELTETVEGTAVVFLKVALSAVAPGLGLLITHIEMAWSVVKWLQVVSFDRGIAVDFPIPISTGLDIEVSLHAGRPPTAEEPPITICFEPASGPDPGVLVVGGCQVSPGEKIKMKQSSREHYRSNAFLVNMQISRIMSQQRDEAIRAAALMRFSRNYLVPRLRKRRRLWEHLEANRVECIIFYDEKAQESIWLFFGQASERLNQTPIPFDAAGRLIPW